MTGERFFTINDVAKRFGINTKTVYRLAQQGALPGFKVGNQWRFSEEMLKNWVAEQVTNERTKKNGRDE
ncbi:MAG: helix-turn-helix domain-containing protein [Candidatus Omnitrophota bacterium]|nr:helix-turn-helix domain-containing protein [Candidatus Omnitrophota bacterium]